MFVLLAQLLEDIQQDEVAMWNPFKEIYKNVLLRFNQVTVYFGNILFVYLLC